MITTLIIWFLIILCGLLVALLLLPFRISIEGRADDWRGLSYELAMDYAFGLIGIRTVNGEPVRISFLGLKIWSFSIESLKREKEVKEKKKKKTSARALFKWTKANFQKMVEIFRRIVRALFLKGYMEGWIGLPDPADTALIGLFFQHLRISQERFRLSVDCVYDREIIRINARVKATLIIGYLGLVLLGLILEKETRIMLRGFTRTQTKEV